MLFRFFVLLTFLFVAFPARPTAAGVVWEDGISPPIVRFGTTYPLPNAKGEVTVRYQLQSDKPITQIVITVNGHVVVSHEDLSLGKTTQVIREESVPVSGYTFSISVRALNSAGWGEVENRFVPPPPVVRILSTQAAPDADGEATVRYLLRSAAPVEQVAVAVDGRETLVLKNLSVRANPEVVREVKVPAPGPTFSFSLRASNGEWSEPDERLFMPLVAPPPAKAPKKPAFVLAVGINNYYPDAYKLSFCTNDALDLSSAIKNQAGVAFGDVQVRLLLDKGASRAAILAGLKWVREGVRDRNGVGLVFLSGLGVRRDEHSYFIPQDFDFDTNTSKPISTSALSMETMGAALRPAPAPIFVFIDSCHAAPDELRGDDPNLAVFAASERDQVAREDARWKGGLFSYCLAAGLRGAASGNGVVSAATLFNYAASRVNELSEQDQSPRISLGAAAGNVALALSPDALKTRGAPDIETEVPDAKPARLFALVVGISTYNDKTLKLDYADKDAQSFTEALQELKPSFASQEIRTRLNDQATRQTLVADLKWLADSATQSDDLAIVYFAGHGSDGAGDSYYLLPCDFARTDPDSTGLFDSDLLRPVGRMKARTLVFLDACGSGDAAGSQLNQGWMLNRLMNARSDKTGSVFVLSATGKEAARESPAFGDGHGAFTAALLEGLEGKAANSAGELRCLNLFLYASDSVRKNTKEAQIPTLYIPGGQDFAFARCFKVPALLPVSAAN